MYVVIINISSSELSDLYLLFVLGEVGTKGVGLVKKKLIF
jgi:hypothetical protein